MEKTSALNGDLEELVKLLSTILDQARTGITIADMTRKEGIAPVYVNKTFSTITGYEEDEILGKNLKLLQGEDTNQEGIAIMAKAIARQEPCEVTLRNYKKTGEMFWNMVSLAPVFDDNGKLHYYIGTQHDVTKLKEQELEIDQQHSFIQTVMDSQPNMILVTNGDDIEYANKSFLDFYNCSDTEEFKRDYGCICNGFVRNDRFFHMGKVKAGESWIEILSKMEPYEQIISLMCPSLEGKAFKIEIREFDNKRHIMTFSDISQNMLKQFEAEDAANTDTLTKLYNRTFFEKHARLFIIEEEAKGHKAGIIMLDIDNFKSINDNYGHNSGDEVLVEVSKTLKKNVRSKDMVVRWGGEEFLIMATIDSVEQLHQLSEKLRKKIKQLVFDGIGSISASFGVTEYQVDNTLLQNIANADKALYSSKNNGRDQSTIFSKDL
jgi:diguanylate cyclase (GGDEF)-like protein/PAS domain S-box-containing protein